VGPPQAPHLSRLPERFPISDHLLQWRRGKRSIPLGLSEFTRVE